MALSSITPISGGIIGRGNLITVTWDNDNFPNIYLRKSGTDEVISAPGAPSYSFSPGYTGTVTPLGGNVFEIAFRRDAGWPDSDFIIRIYDGWTGVEEQANYTILAEGQYPPDMQPFNDPAPDEGSSDIAIQDDGSPQGTATTINYATGLTAVVSGGVAQIDTQAGLGDVTSSESVGTVQNSEITVFDGTDGKTIKGGGTGTYVNASGIVTAAGFSTISGRVTAGEAVRLNGPTAYYYASEWASGNPSPEGSGGQYWCASPEHGGTPQTRPMFTADDGTNYDLSEGASGSGDVSSSESSGTVQSSEITVFDGTDGKTIKGAGTGVYVTGGGLMHATSFSTFSGNITSGGTFRLANPEGYYFASNVDTVPPTAEVGGGKFWCKNKIMDSTPQNRPMFTADDGTHYDLSEGSGGYSSIAALNGDISPDRVGNIHIQSTTPAVAVDGDIWIETA